MKFGETENLLLARLIGLCAGVEAEPTQVDVLGIVVRSLSALKDGTATMELADEVRSIKKKALPNCFDCAFPCGRTNDYFLLSLPDEVRNRKLSLLEDILASNEDLIGKISELSYR